MANPAEGKGRVVVSNCHGSRDGGKIVRAIELVVRLGQTAVQKGLHADTPENKLRSPAFYSAFAVFFVLVLPF